MKYKLLETLGSNSERRNVTSLDSFQPTPYIKELRMLKHVNSINACLLMARFEILFSQNPDYFCKYLLPCEWQDDLEGLSWGEELGWTRTELNTALKAIVTRYRTVEEFLIAEDKFKGKYYCSCVNSADYNKTYFFRNDELVNRCLEELLNETTSNKADLG